MNCDLYTVLLSGHIDGMNTPQEEQALQAHLQQCADCRELLAQMRQNDEKLKREHIEVPPELKDRIMAEVRKTKKNKKPFYISLAASAVAAAAVLAIVFSGRITPPSKPQELTTAMIAQELKQPIRKIDFAKEPACEDAMGAENIDLSEAPAEQASEMEAIEAPCAEGTELREDKETTQMCALLVIHADADELDFSGKRCELSGVADVLSESGYVLTGQETAIYTVSWQTMLELLSYEDTVEMQRYFEGECSEAVIIFTK